MESSSVLRLQPAESTMAKVSATQQRTILQGCCITISCLPVSYTPLSSILEYCDPQPMEFMTDEDGTFDWGSEMTYVDKQAAYSISANCENPELALEFLNYFFTEDGSLIVNYGVEGYTWERTADGEAAWTEVVTNNPDGMSAQTAVNAYTGTALLACLQISGRMFSTYSLSLIHISRRVRRTPPPGIRPRR